jgi:hypothetical protein
MTEDQRPDQDGQDEEQAEAEERLTPGSDEAKKAESDDEAEDEARQSINDAFD